MEDPKFYQGPEWEERRKKIRQIEEETLLEQQANLRRLRAMQTGGGVAGSSKLAPGGPNGSIQYNNNGTLSGHPDFTFELVQGPFSSAKTTSLIPTIRLDGSIEVTGEINGAKIGDAIEVDYETLKILGPNQQLKPGQIYAVSGFNKNMPCITTANPCCRLPEVLYDDGTNSGITIFVEALTSRELSSTGFGLFYNPVYLDQNIYNGSYLTRYYGIWDGNNPDPSSVPVYGIGDIVFWGNYAWENISGQNGTVVDILSLSSADWRKIDYTTGTKLLGVYEPVIDEIKIDWTHNILIERTNSANQITVAFNADQYESQNLFHSIQCNPISVMAWGLYPAYSNDCKLSEIYGLSNIKCINSYVETVNFKGKHFLNSEFENSKMHSNYVGDNVTINYVSSKSCSYITENSLYNYTNLTNINLEDISDFATNIIKNYSNIEKLSLIHKSSFSNNFIDQTSEVKSNILESSSITLNNLYGSESKIEYNRLFRSLIQNNTYVASYSKISDNQMSLGQITFNTLNSQSDIGGFLCQISGNTLTGGAADSTIPGSFTGAVAYSSISNNELINSSEISNNILTQVSIISGYELISSSFQLCFFRRSTFDGVYLGPSRIVLNNKFVRNLEAVDVFVGDDISAGNNIFGYGKKTVYRRNDTNIRLMYFTNSDTPQYSTITA